MELCHFDVEQVFIPNPQTALDYDVYTRLPQACGGEVSGVELKMSNSTRACMVRQLGRRFNL